MEITPEIQPTVAAGGGDPPNAPKPPKGYVPTTPQQRTDWNGFLDYLGKQGNIDLNNPQVGTNFLNQYKQNNPNFSITPEMVPFIQYENNQFRKGTSFSTLTPEQLQTARTGMSPNFLNISSDINGTIDSNTAKLRYPQFVSGDKNFGTNVEDYLKFKSGNVSPATEPKQQPVAQPINSTPAGALQRPNYDDPKSRLQYAEQFRQKYGTLPGRGDTVLRVNEVPEGGTDTAKDSATKAASKLGLDPALLYSSAMEEGMSGLFPDKNGEISTGDGKPPDPKYQVDGFYNYGLDNFHDQFPELVKRGYLPKDFDYKPHTTKNENGQSVNSAYFKTPEDAMQAKAAYVKYEQDDIDKYAKQKGITLSDKARQFFTLINFNGGEGTGHKMIDYYNSKGLLAGDKYLSVAPAEGLRLAPSWKNVVPRIKMAEGLKKEGLF
jgi:hypothetical protein